MHETMTEKWEKKQMSKTCYALPFPYHVPNMSTKPILNKK